MIALRTCFSRLFLAPVITVFFVLAASSALASGSKEAEAQGAILFRDKGCARCHGATGLGTKKGPSLANVRQTMKPEQITNQIENGGMQMPSFSDSLSNDEVAQLVAFLRAKHRPVAPPAPAPEQSSATVSNPEQ